MTTVGRSGAAGLVPPSPQPVESIKSRTKTTGMRKVDRRTKVALALCALTAITVNVGAAWAYWRITGTGTGVAQAGSTVELSLQGRSDETKPLYPGGSSSLTVSVTNANSFPIKITSLSPDEGIVTADRTHREAGCHTTGVVISSTTLSVSWIVARNTVGAFTLPDGITMTNDSDSACQGATFTIPITATGISVAP